MECNRTSIFSHYCSVLVLRKISNKVMYRYFLLLVLTSRILCDPELCRVYCNYARKLFKKFVKLLSSLYGTDAQINTDDANIVANAIYNYYLRVYEIEDYCLQRSNGESASELYNWRQHIMPFVSNWNATIVPVKSMNL